MSQKSNNKKRCLLSDNMINHVEVNISDKTTLSIGE
jgi:hypothetical protein